MTAHSPFEEDKIAGTLVGLAVGDALGAPAEFKSRGDVRRKFPHGMQEMRASGPWSAGEYTDDTQMALLLADSLLEKGRFDAGDIARRFRHWSRSAKDVGIQIRRVTAMKGYELDPEECSRRDFIEHPHGAAGNGAVTRCAPVALFHLGNETMLYANSRRSALVTHGDPKALTSCVLINAAIAYFILHGDRDSPWRHGMKSLTPDESAAWSRLESIASTSEENILSNGYTVSSVEASFWCFTRTESFEAAAEMAASLGGDADTTAAITGALAGAHYGYQAIPERWRTQLLKCAHIRDTALRLAAKGYGVRCVAI
jgi:ADP-ribosylglycohydrolase